MWRLKNVGGVFTSGCACVLAHRRRRLCAADDCTDDDLRGRRVVTVRGSAVDRGAMLGALLGPSILELAERRQAMYSRKGLDAWRAIAEGAAHAWPRHAPVSWAELHGMRRGCFAQAADLCMLGTDFEMQMNSWREEGLFADTPGGPPSNEPSGGSPSDPPGRCTGFAVTDGVGPSGAGGLPLCGQNVDEDPSDWLGGSRDVIVRHVADPDGTPDALVYTHPGVPAYCGMNSAGLAVMNLFIDDGERDAAGVPIDVALREVLCQRDIRSAVEYLEGLPRMAPTTYVLVQAGTIAAVEAPCGRTTTVWMHGRGEFCHSNHPILDQRMASDCGDPGASTVSRLQQMQEAVRANRGAVDAELARKLLGDIPPAHKNYAPTIARVVMEPSHGLLHVLFRGESRWLVVGFADD